MLLSQVFHCHFNSNFFPLFLEHLLSDQISVSTGSFLLGEWQTGPKGAAGAGPGLCSAFTNPSWGEVLAHRALGCKIHASFPGTSCLGTGGVTWSLF